MAETRSLLERADRAIAHLPTPGMSLDELRRRRDHKRRTRRIASGLTAAAVFVAAIALFTLGASHRGSVPGVGGPTGPVPSGPPLPPDPALQDWSVGLPPSGSAPSLPVRGELVLSFSFHNGPTEAGAFHLFLYRDGRVLWDRWGASDGFQEQRLTSEGVDLVSSAALATGLLDEDRQLLNDRGGPYYADIVVRIRDRSVHLAWGDDRDLDRGRSPSEEQVAAIELLGRQMQDLRSWLPASAWEDATPEPFVATRYVVSFDWKPEESTLGLDPLLAALPDRAEDLLRTEGIDREEYTNLLGTFHYWEVEMTLDHVRTLVEFLERAGARPTDSPHGPSFELDTGVVLPDVTFSVGPVLPHEEI